MYDYTKDRYRKECLKLSQRSNSRLGFGAILVKDGVILGRGWNRRAVLEDRGILTHVDYAIHAEQDCTLDALKKLGLIKRGRIQDATALEGVEIYVLGMVLQGPKKGKLTTRRNKVFICKKCPVSVLIPYRIAINIPHIRGWARLNPEQAMETAKKICGDGYWEKFTL